MANALTGGSGRSYRPPLDPRLSVSLVVLFTTGYLKGIVDTFSKRKGYALICMQ